MNALKAEKLFSLMKQYGVEYFKNENLEIKMTPQAALTSVETPSEQKVVPPQAAPPVDMKIPHHINEVADLLKLTDEELVDKLFPDYSKLPKDGE